MHASESSWDDADSSSLCGQVLDADFEDVKELRGRRHSEVELGKRLYEKNSMGFLTPADRMYVEAAATSVAVVVAVVAYGDREYSQQHA